MRISVDALAQQMLASGPIASLEQQVQATLSSAIYAGSWTELNKIAGTFAFQGAVIATDDGTHTDPVVGGTVANSGIFNWSVSPAGWKRIGSADALIPSSPAPIEIAEMWPRSDFREASMLNGDVTVSVDGVLPGIKVPTGQTGHFSFIWWALPLTPRDVADLVGRTIEIALVAGTANMPGSPAIVVSASARTRTTANTEASGSATPVTYVGDAMKAIIRRPMLILAFCCK